MGDSTDDIVRQITCSRLMADGSREKLEAALQLIDEQEAALMKRLGMSPGAEANRHPGERRFQATGNSHDTYALPLPQMDTRKEAPASPPAFEQGNLRDLIESAESYFRLYQDEPGHDIRMQHIRQVFRDPARISEFLAIHPPSSWARQFQYLYDNIIIPSSAYGHDARDRGIGASPEAAGNTPASTEEMILRNMDRMGL